MNIYARFLWIAVGMVSLSLAFATIGLGFGNPCDPSNCRKCHARIYEEFTSTGAHTSLTCGGCHQNSDLDYSVPISFNLSWLDVPADTPHSAISVTCADCHPEVLDELSGAQEVHRRFYEKSIALQISPNAACIACHTHTDVNMTWKRPTHLNLFVDKGNVTMNW